MNPATFAYHRAASVDEAIALLAQFPDDGKLLAGGHSLLPAMKLRLAEPGNLIDIAAIPGLRGIRRTGATIEIGALTTHHDLERDAVLLASCPVLAETAAKVGDVQVRNRGTIGGALAHADPSADYPAAILALEAEMVAQGPNGVRVIPASKFFVDLFTTSLTPDEVLIAIRVPAATPRAGSSYQKLANQASGYAIVGVAAVVELAADGSCAAVNIGVTGAAAKPFRAAAVEAALRGARLDAAAVKGAVAHATDGVDLLADLHATTDYRARMVAGLASRAILAAAERAGA